jgi:three-Cys-motif partner protein
MDNPRNYLFPLEDGLPMRTSQDYAVDKLYALQAYLEMARTAMKGKDWFAFNYIDLQAGPGKNQIGDKIYLGSPLIALNVDPPFTHFWFNEKNPANFEALRKRTSESPYASQVNLFQKDVNIAVDQVVQSIRRMDDTARSSGKWPTFNVAFLDPEGLEIEWKTVESLARINRMDMIINFSTGGINRVLDRPDAIDRLFGSHDWHKQLEQGQGAPRRRQLINIYRQQLERFGYHIVADPEAGYHDIAMRNSKNAEVYSLIFASKHPLGDNFWSKVKQQVEKLRHGSDRLF